MLSPGRRAGGLSLSESRTQLSEQPGGLLRGSHTQGKAWQGGGWETRSSRGRDLLGPAVASVGTTVMRLPRCSRGTRTRKRKETVRLHPVPQRSLPGGRLSALGLLLLKKMTEDHMFPILLISGMAR